MFGMRPIPELAVGAGRTARTIGGDFLVDPQAGIVTAARASRSARKTTVDRLENIDASILGANLY
jgi:hypothetical protein